MKHTKPVRITQYSINGVKTRHYTTWTNGLNAFLQLKATMLVHPDNHATLSVLTDNGWNVQASLYNGAITYASTGYAYAAIKQEATA